MRSGGSGRAMRVFVALLGHGALPFPQRYWSFGGILCGCGGENQKAELVDNTKGHRLPLALTQARLETCGREDMKIAFETVTARQTQRSFDQLVTDFLQQNSACNRARL